MNSRPNIPAFAELFAQPIFSLILIFLIGLSIYANILHAPPQIDDHDLLFGNPLIKDIPEFCRHWYVQNSQKALTLLTFAINYYFSKEDTFSYHLVNVLLHIMAAFFLYYFIRALASTPELSKSSVFKEKNFLALFATLIFIVHPVQTQAVTYLWQRSEVLSGFFYMAALLSYLSARLQGKKFYYALTIFLYVVGFFAKGTIISLPLMIFLIEISFLQTDKFKQFLKKDWKLLTILIILYFINTKTPGSIINYYLTFPFPHLGFLSVHFFPDYWLTQYRVMWKYIKLAFLPIDQNIDYDILRSYSFLEPMVLISFLGLLALGAMVVLLFRRHRLMAFGIVWFFIYLLPTSVINREPMWEYRLYLSLAGFAIFLAAGIFTVFPGPRIRTIVAVSMIIVFGVLTMMRNSLWCSPVLLLEDTVKKSPRKARPHHMLGDVYMRGGQIEKAVEQFQIAIHLDSNYGDSYNNLGIIYIKIGNIEKAMKCFEQAIALRPSQESPYVNLAYIFLYQKGDQAKAEEFFKKSLMYKETVEGYIGLGNLYIEKKDFVNALGAFTKASKLSYNNPDVFYSLGNVYYFQNDYQKALEMYNKTIHLDKSFADSYYNIGMIYYQTKEFELSRQWLQKAFWQKPNRLDMCQGLVRVHEALSETKKAEDYRQRCQSLTQGLNNNSLGF